MGAYCVAALAPRSRRKGGTIHVDGGTQYASFLRHDRRCSASDLTRDCGHGRFGKIVEFRMGRLNAPAVQVSPSRFEGSSGQLGERHSEFGPCSDKI